MKHCSNRIWKYLNISLLYSLIITLTISAGCSKEEDNTLEWNKQIAVAYVHSYAVVIGAAMTEMKDEATRIAYIRRAIDPIRFYPDSSGYFFVYDFDGVNIAHAVQKELQGQNLNDYTDSRGLYLAREFTELAKSGGGYLEYYFVKPGETQEKKKLGYVEPIPDTDYYIGTGVYLE
jgi:signal transduction histidine kinase